MVHRVKKVEYISGYKLQLHFENGKIKSVDLEDMLKNEQNMFLQLMNIEYFKKVICDGYSICWPNGIDFCPDLLYKKGEDISVLARKNKKPVPVVKGRRKAKKKVAN